MVNDDTKGNIDVEMWMIIQRSYICLRLFCENG